MKKSLKAVFLLLLTSKAIGQYSYTSPTHTFTTPYGNIQMGPLNADWAHIYTDRSKFIFNKDVYSMAGFSSYTASNLSLKTSGTTRMTILNTNGNVGIGTSSPREKLEINGNLLLPVGSGLKLGSFDATTTNGYFWLENASCCYNTYAHIKGSMFFDIANGPTIMGLQSDGTVTIGVWEKYDNTITNTDGHKLMVNGGILCERMKVISDVPNSDHVFAPTYKLRSLEEVKEYVSKYKHLPEIPSAEEFQKNGYYVGEMDDVLLRKVEELTLYLIQLKEDNEALKKKVELLEKK